MAENVEFLECGGLSITYDATGVATINATVAKSSSGDLSNSYESWNLGGVSFTGNVMTASQAPLIGSGGWFQWSITWQGVGN